MATKTLYFKNVTVNGALSLQDGGTAPTGALTTTGWTMAKLASPNYSLMAVGTKKASGTFGTADALATPAFTAVMLQVGQPYSGTFGNQGWTFNFRVRAGTASAQQARLVRSGSRRDAAGTVGLVQLTSAVQVGAPRLRTDHRFRHQHGDLESAGHLVRQRYLWVSASG
jgi:hypothetical protein